jgi:hypothetical protein
MPLREGKKEMAATVRFAADPLAPVSAQLDHEPSFDRPRWDRLGLTVTPDGRHRVWLDEPDGAHTWELPTR